PDVRDRESDRARQRADPQLPGCLLEPPTGQGVVEHPDAEHIAIRIHVRRNQVGASRPGRRPHPVMRRRRHGVRPGTYLFFFISFALFIFLTHAVYFDLPYFWDELGQFVPAALDIYHDGAWVPHSTVPNAHPPGVMAYLAGIWKIAGFSIVA